MHISPGEYAYIFGGINLYIRSSPNGGSAGSFYYRDRFWNAGTERVFPYCGGPVTQCVNPPSVFGLKTIDSLDTLKLTCDAHTNRRRLTMPLTDAQRETQIKIFTEQKELLKNHPFMDVAEDGSVIVNRTRCLDFLQELAEAEFMLRAKQQAVVYFLEEDLRDRGEAEKKKIRAYDAAHKNLKSGNEIEQANRAAKKADGSISKYEAMILKVMDRLKCSRDAAVKFIEED